MRLQADIELNKNEAETDVRCDSLRYAVSTILPLLEIMKNAERLNSRFGYSAMNRVSRRNASCPASAAKA